MTDDAKYDVAVIGGGFAGCRYDRSGTEEGGREAAAGWRGRVGVAEPAEAAGGEAEVGAGCVSRALVLSARPLGAGSTPPTTGGVSDRSVRPTACACSLK